jgi:hypothetical protein
MLGRVVSGAMIFIRPLQRAMSSRKTRQINEAQGKRQPDTGAVAEATEPSASRPGREPFVAPVWDSVLGKPEPL